MQHIKKFLQSFAKASRAFGDGYHKTKAEQTKKNLIDTTRQDLKEISVL